VSPRTREGPSRKTIALVALSSAPLDRWRYGYVTRLVRASRPGTSPVPAVRDWVRWGAGPRAGQALILAAKARALMQGRCGVTREDLRTLALPVLRHRILLNFQAEAEGRTPDEVVATLLAAVERPRSGLA